MTAFLLRRALPWVVLATACASPSAAPRPTTPPPPAVTLQPGDLAITDVTVVPMSRPGVVPHQTVVVRGGKILAVVPSASLAVPAGASTIDGANRWLMPGLADMHVHTWSEGDLTLFLAAGVTTVRNMFGSEQHLAWRSQIAAGERLGPTIVTAGPIIDGEPPVWPGSAVLVDPTAADRLVAEQKAKGYDFLKPYARLSRPAYEALAAAGKKHGMRLAGHVPNDVGLLGVLAAHQRSIEHFDGWLLAMAPDGTPPVKDAGITGGLRELLPRLDAAKLPGLVSRTLAAGTWNCPTLIVYDRFGALEDPAALGKRTRWLAEVSPAVVEGWDPKRGPRAYTAEDYAAIRTANQWRARVFAALTAANAPIIVGTDTGNPYVVPGEAMHDEIELMVAAGMARERVLRAATAAAAEFLETPGAFGVVEPGARADLLLVAVNPLAEPLPLIPEGVIVRGRWLPRADLEARLAELARHHAAPPAKVQWDELPPLVAIGKDVHPARYELQLHGKPIGEERLAVGTVRPGQRAVVAQAVADYGIRIETASTIAPDGVSVAVKSPYGAYAVTGKLAAGQLVVTGTDAAGKPVSLRGALPRGAFLSGPGTAGAVALAGQLAGLEVGGKRTLAALELTYYPAVAITTVDYTVERKPDGDGHRRFAITAARGKAVTTGELELDAAGVVSQRIGPPFDSVATRIANER